MGASAVLMFTYNAGTTQCIDKTKTFTSTCAEMLCESLQSARSCWEKRMCEDPWGIKLLMGCAITWGCSKQERGVCSTKSKSCFFGHHIFRTRIYERRVAGHRISDRFYPHTDLLEMSEWISQECNGFGQDVCT